MLNLGIYIYFYSRIYRYSFYERLLSIISSVLVEFLDNIDIVDSLINTM